MPRYGKEGVDAPAFSAGKRTAEPIRQRELLKKLVLKITGTWAVAGGDGSGTIHTDAIFRLIADVTVKADGQTLINIVGQTLRLLEKFLYESVYVQDPPTSLAAGANETIELRVDLPFFMPWSFEPHWFALPTTEVRAPTVSLNAGVVGDLWYGGGAPGVPSLANMTVEMQEVPQYGTPPGREFYDPLFIASTQMDLVASGDNLKLYLDAAHIEGAEIRAVILETLANGASGTDYRHNSAVIDNLTLNVGGVDVVGQQTFADLQQDNAQTYKLAALETGAVIFDAASDKMTGVGELWSVGSQRPYIKFKATKQAGDNLIRATVIYTRGRFKKLAERAAA